MAARQSMRLYDPVAKKYGTSGPLTTKRPALPAAVPLFSHGRARILALDFDAKTHGADAVVDDVARMLQWLRECGGRAVVDVSSSGGRHVLVPLAPGKTVTAEQIRPLLRLLAARLRTLDITPMTNPASGCITVPGSACKEGGHRRLVDLDPATAADQLTVGSDPGTLTRLEALLGGSSTVITHPVAAQIHTAAATERILGSGGETRLHPRFCRSTPPPAAVTEFAATGRRDRTRWPSRSEARHVRHHPRRPRRHSSDDIVARAAAPDWAGLRAAYAHYAEPRARSAATPPPPSTGPHRPSLIQSGMLGTSKSTQGVPPTQFYDLGLPTLKPGSLVNSSLAVTAGPPMWLFKPWHGLQRCQVRLSKEFLRWG
ncbi:hypothetical protein BJF84_26595 [Rhodococcus sp. CUA-806]|nr:hypothetical protein BJF84_26595 [Rhodococcus sp. CUA-806]